MLAVRPFRLMFGAHAISTLGDRVVAIATVFAVLEVTGSATALGFVFAATLGPRLAFTLIGGVWGDRLPRARLMLGSDLARAAIQATVAVLLLSGTARLWHLLVLGATYGVADAFFDPAASGLVAETVEPHQLQSANALMGVSRSAIGVAGPALGGILVALAGTGLVFAIDGASFVLSALLLARLRLVRPEAGAHDSFVAELAHGWSELRSRRWLWASIVYFSAWNLAFAPFFVLGPLVARRSLHGATSWGVIMTGAAIGSILGASLMLRFRPGRPLLLGYGLISICALPLVLLSRPASTAVLTIATLLAFTTLGIGITVWTTTLQANVPRRALARLSAYDLLGSLIFQPVGFALAGPLATLIGLRATLLGSAGALVFASFAVLTLVPEVRRVSAAGATVAGP